MFPGQTLLTTGTFIPLSLYVHKMPAGQRRNYLQVTASPSSSRILGKSRLVFRTVVSYHEVDKLCILHVSREKKKKIEGWVGGGWGAQSTQGSCLRRLVATSKSDQNSVLSDTGVALEPTAYWEHLDLFIVQFLQEKKKVWGEEEWADFLIK